MKKAQFIVLLIAGTLLSLTFANTTYAANSGWDYNLTKRCAKSPYPDKLNYYQDTTQCDTSNKNWTIAVQSEKELGVSCSGVANQSLPINQPGSPLSLDWIPHSDEFANQNWQVNLSTDFITKTNPCGANHFTWYTLMDHVAHNGGPFALPNNLSTSVSAKLSQDNPNGATRAFLGWQGYWDGKSHGIEINFFHTDNWGDADSQPDIITSIKNPTLEFISMDGRTLGLNLNPGETKMLYVKWVDIIQSLIARGYLTAPSDGWNNSASTAVYIGTEVNNFTDTNAAKTMLSVTNFRSFDSNTYQNTDSLLSDLKSSGCVYSGIVANYDPNYAHLDDEYIPMIGRSSCQFLYRAIETWGYPPNFDKITADISKINQGTGRQLTYQMMLAEAIPTSFSSKFPQEYQQFNFTQMCADQQPTSVGIGLCVPSLEKPEYRRYIEYVVNRALDAGVNAFLFGQIYLQDPQWHSQPQFPNLAARIRQIALEKQRNILIGAQTNHISDRAYLETFDHIDGGVFWGVDNTINFDDTCAEGGIPDQNNPNPNSPWWNCTAHLWQPMFSQYAKAVIISLDWSDSTTDDIHRFVSQSKIQRQATVTQIHQELTNRHTTFLPTYIAPFAGERTQNLCFGLYPWIYSAAKEGSTVRDQWNNVEPGPYSCADEVWLDTLFSNQLKGDLNHDNKVDIFDYNIMVASFGHPYNIFDYNQLVANFGKSL